MNKSKPKTYVPQARKDFIAAATVRANLLGLSIISPCEKGVKQCVDLRWVLSNLIGGYDT